MLLGLALSATRYTPTTTTLAATAVPVAGRSHNQGHFTCCYCSCGQARPFAASVADGLRRAQRLQQETLAPDGAQKSRRGAWPPRMSWTGPEGRFALNPVVRGRGPAASDPLCDGAIGMRRGSDSRQWRSSPSSAGGRVGHRRRPSLPGGSPTDTQSGARGSTGMWIPPSRRSRAGDGLGPESPGFPIRRSDDLLRVQAGDRTGERRSRRLLPPRSKGAHVIRQN